MRTANEVIHKSFTIERVYSCSPSRVFSAFSDVTEKRCWFAEGPGFVVGSHELDFRVGGFERTRFRFGDGPEMTNDCLYLAIEENERMVFAYSTTLAGAPLSSSLASIELFETDAGTTMRFFEHTAFLDGNDGSVGRREGTGELVAALGRELEGDA